MPSVFDRLYNTETASTAAKRHPKVGDRPPPTKNDHSPRNKTSGTSTKPIHRKTPHSKKTEKEPATRTPLPADKKQPKAGAPTPAASSSKAAARPEGGATALKPKLPTDAQKVPLPPKSEILALFERLDPNGNGLLSLAELDKGVIEIFPDYNHKH